MAKKGKAGKPRKSTGGSNKAESSPPPVEPEKIVPDTAKVDYPRLGNPQNVVDAAIPSAAKKAEVAAP
ncbi:hypothetical protein GGI14_004781, partial [Coemansia sp. S680]